MKLYFIPAKFKPEFSLPLERISELPQRLALVSPVQFVDHLPRIKTQLEQAGKTVQLVQGKHSRSSGQILGCDVPVLPTENIDAFLYIGDGVFHPYEVLYKNNLELFIFNPKTNDFYKIGRQEADDNLRKQKGALSKFYYCKNIGVLISTKPGQDRLRFTRGLEEKFPDKKFYFFACDTLEYSQLENFPFIEVFINTMCQRITLEDAKKVPRPIINLEDLPEYKGIP